jgi:hypothetical protein
MEEPIELLVKTHSLADLALKIVVKWMDGVFVNNDR